MPSVGSWVPRIIIMIIVIVIIMIIIIIIIIMNITGAAEGC